MLLERWLRILAGDGSCVKRRQVAWNLVNNSATTLPPNLSLNREKRVAQISSSEVRGFSQWIDTKAAELQNNSGYSATLLYIAYTD